MPYLIKQFLDNYLLLTNAFNNIKNSLGVVFEIFVVNKQMG